MVINKYQISINRIISYKYVRELFLNKNLDIIKMTKDTIDGYNENEVVLVAKKLKKRDFLKNFSIFSINLYFIVIFVVFYFPILKRKYSCVIFKSKNN